MVPNSNSFFFIILSTSLAYSCILSISSFFLTNFSISVSRSTFQIFCSACNSSWSVFYLAYFILNNSLFKRSLQIWSSFASFSSWSTLLRSYLSYCSSSYSYLCSYLYSASYFSYVNIFIFLSKLAILLSSSISSSILASIYSGPIEN